MAETNRYEMENAMYRTYKKAISVKPKGDGGEISGRPYTPLQHPHESNGDFKQRFDEYLRGIGEL